MKGFVPTPPAVVDLMVDKLFAGAPPCSSARLVDPGCGPGAFIEGILRWCRNRGIEPPHIVGIDSDPTHVAVSRRKFRGERKVEIRNADFLRPSQESFDHVIGNPPYVSLARLTRQERGDYRGRYRTATNRFDLYGLFFEQALSQLEPGGLLVFITPEKFLYVESAAALRRVLGERGVTELHFLPEDTFGDLVTYPLVTTIGGKGHSGNGQACTVITRDAQRRTITLPVDGRSWLPAVTGAQEYHGSTLEDVALRISCGVATGSDREFVVADRILDASLRPYSYPTIAGRQLVPGKEPVVVDRLLVPYDRSGKLLPEASLGALGAYLSDERRKAVLLARTCVRVKPWYCFHENPPLREILRPKILCKDVGSVPHFFVDRSGVIVPRHSVYYIVPRNGDMLDRLVEYLNGDQAREWLLKHCQRAAGGFVRLQSHVLKGLPVSAELVGQAEARRIDVKRQLHLERTIPDFPVADVR